MTGSGISSDGLDARRRRLLFRSWHRGIREMDLVLGRFADAQIASLTDAELDEYERWLEIPDQQIFAWVNGAETAPADDRHRAVPPPARLPSQGLGTDVSAPAKSPAELLRPGKALTLAQVADGAEGLVLADLARSVAARTDAPAISLAVICRDGQRMAALSRALAFFGPDIAVMEFPAWDCLPYDRVSPNASGRGAAHDRVVAAGARERPRQAVGAFDDGQRRAAARAGARIRRHPCAVGRARQCARHGRRDRMAGAQWLHPRLDRARAGRIRGARRHPRSVSARHGHAGALRFLRRRAGDDPHLRSADAAQRDASCAGSIWCRSRNSSSSPKPSAASAPAMSPRSAPPRRTICCTRR